MGTSTLEIMEEVSGGGVWADGSKEAFSKRSLMEFEILKVELVY